MAIVDPKDSVFANAADAVSDFETIFDDEDSIIEMVEGFGENGESLIGRDPEEEFTTDNSDGKVDMEDSSPSTAVDIEPDAETGKGVIESTDLDDIFGVNESEEQTDETDKKDILEEPVETDKKDFHDGEVQVDNVKEEAEQTDETNKKDILEEPVETEDKDFHDEAADVQTDETNKKDILEEPVETDEKDFHDEAAMDLDDLFGVNEETIEGEKDHDEFNDSNEGIDKEVNNTTTSEPQTDETNKSDILEEPVETDEKDFHDEAAVELDELFNALEEESELGVQDDLGVQKDLGVDDDLGAQGDECNELTHGSLCPKCGCDPCKCGGKSGAGEEQTDETDKKDILEEPDDKEVKDFHNEGAELDALFEALEIEGESDHEDFDESEEGIEKEVKEAAEEEIDYAEDELIDAADNNDGGADVKLDYAPGEDDAIIDDVISGKDA